MAANTGYFLPCSDPWILAAMNSPLSWWLAWRTAIHGKDEALRFLGNFVEVFPIPRSTDDIRTQSEQATRNLIDLTRQQSATTTQILDWLRIEFEIEKPTRNLQSHIALNPDAFVNEVRKIRGKKKPLTSAAQKRLRDEHS